MLRSNVVTLPTPKAKPALPAWMHWGGAIAASLVLGLAIGHSWRDGGSIRTRDGQLYAAGALAGALDSQLAANQGAVQVPVTFRDGKGSYCRVFTSTATSGIACRDTDGWALRQTRAGTAAASTGYVQAGSADAALMADAQEMMAGDPLDAAAEAKARAAGWR